MKERGLSETAVFKAAAVAILTAVTTVFTLLVRVPIPATKGYFNLSDVAVFFSAFTLGPLTALISGGLGTALADLMSGYAQWAPISLAAHGLEGLVAALIGSAAWHFSTGEPAVRGRRMLWWVVGGLAGSVVMIGAYLAGGYALAGAGALGEVPFNAIQAAVGVAVGIPLSISVRMAYPPVRAYRW